MLLDYVQDLLILAFTMGTILMGALLYFVNK